MSDGLVNSIERGLLRSISDALVAHGHDPAEEHLREWRTAPRASKPSSGAHALKSGVELALKSGVELALKSGVTHALVRPSG
jgi:hypothetical protein